ncbi:MAG: ABC transporter substrate-binding protein [Acidimicrobiia bacterium]
MTSPRTTTTGKRRASRSVPVAALLLVLALVAAACGDDSDDAGTTPSSEAPAGSSGSSTDDAKDEEEDADPTGEEAFGKVIKVGGPIGGAPAVKAAVDQGFFEEEGLEVEYQQLSGGPEALTATIGGSVDVAYCDIFAWVGSLANGFDTQLLQAANGPGGGSTVLARPGSGIEEPKDLEGKKLAIIALPLSRVQANIWLESSGVDPDKVELVSVTQRDTMGAITSQGQVDATMISDPYSPIWQDEYGLEPIGEIVDGKLPADATIAAYLVRGDWAEKNPVTAERFVRAIRKGADFLNNATPEEKAELKLKWDKLDLFALDEKTPGVLANFHDSIYRDGPLDLEDTNEWLETGLKYGAIEKLVDIEPHLAPVGQKATL